MNAAMPVDLRVSLLTIFNYRLDSAIIINFTTV
jgi:hypothetical protein